MSVPAKIEEMERQVSVAMFDTLGPDYIRPTKLSFGLLDRGLLKVWHRTDAGDWNFLRNFTPRQILLDFNKRRELGAIIQNRMYCYVSLREPANLGEFLAMDIANGKARFFSVKRPEHDVAHAAKQFGSDLVFKSPVPDFPIVIYNETASPEPLLGFLSYEPDVSHAIRWQFIDWCVAYGTEEIRKSQDRLEKMLSAAKAGEQGVANAIFDEAWQAFSKRGETYLRLDKILSALKYAKYFKYLDYLAGPDDLVARGMIEEGVQEDYEKLIKDDLPELDKALLEGKAKTNIDGMIERIEAQMKQLRSAAPLLGRLDWEDVKHLLSTPETAKRTFASKVVDLIENELLSDNKQALESIEDDMDDIRGALTLIPPRVMGIKKIIGHVEREHVAEIQSDARMFWAVEKLKEHAATFPLFLGFASLVFGIFCPPVGAALSIISAGISVDDAIFKDAVSDADIDIDKTFITQAEAREAAIWAGVDVLFAGLDAAGAVKSLKAAGEMAEVADLAKLPKSADEAHSMLELGAAGTKALDEVGDLGKTFEEVASLEKKGIAHAAEDAVDGRKVTRELSHGKLDPDGANRLKEVARDADIDVEAIIKQGKQSNEIGLLEREIKANLRTEEAITRELNDAFGKIDDAYRKHVADTLSARKAAREAGEALPPAPLTYEAFAPTHYIEDLRKTFQPKAVPASTRKRFYRALADPADTKGAKLGEFLADDEKVFQALKQQALDDAKHGIRRSVDPDLNWFWKAANNGVSDDGLKKILKSDLLDKLDDIGRRVGLDSPAGRDFGLFASGVRDATDWGDKALGGLRKTFENSRIDKDALSRIMNRGRLDKTPGLRERLAESLGEITATRVVDGKDVPAILGVTERVSRSNPSLIDALVDGSRGHAYEAIVTADVLKHVPHDAKVTVGRRFWLKYVDDVNVEGVLKTKTHAMNNVVEADVMIEFADGRRVLIDAKFYADTLAVSETMVNQSAKIVTALDEGVVHNARYIVSHNVSKLEEIEVKGAKGTWTSRLESHADLVTTPDGRLQIIHGHYDDGLRSIGDLASDTYVKTNKAGEILSMVEVETKLTPPAGARLNVPEVKILIPEPPLPVRVADIPPSVPQARVALEAATIPRSGLGVALPVRPTAAAGKLTLTVGRWLSQAESEKRLGSTNVLRIPKDSVSGRLLSPGTFRVITGADVAVTNTDVDAKRIVRTSEFWLSEFKTHHLVLSMAPKVPATVSLVVRDLDGRFLGTLGTPIEIAPPVTLISLSLDQPPFRFDFGLGVYNVICRFHENKGTFDSGVSWRVALKSG